MELAETLFNGGRVVATTKKKAAPKKAATKKAPAKKAAKKK
jgi:hypothetical protein